MNNFSSGVSPVSKDLSHCIEQLKAVLKHLRYDVLASSYRALCDRLESRLEEIEREASREVECALTLLGESGAGKSTLINALIGADLLPHDGVQAVTAAVCEVGRGDQGYVIQTTLRDRQASNEMLDRLWRCVQQAVNDRGEEGASESQLEIDASHRRMLRSITGKSPEECVSAGCGSLDSLLLDPVREALSGVRERQFEFDRSASQQAKACIRDHIATDSPMWPFVERLSVRGPFGSIPRGVRIVDIPGLNDPDEAREMVARKYLATANSVWLVLSYKRAFTREVVEYLHDSGLLHNLYVRGRIGTFAVVVTHLDGIDAAAIVERRGLPPETSNSELLQHGRDDVVMAVRRTLDEVWNETIRRASQSQGDPLKCEEGRHIIRQAPVFVVDSADYMRHLKVMRSFGRTAFESPEESGVPGLQRWLEEELLGREQDSVRSQALAAVMGLAEQIESDVGNQIQVKTGLLNWRKKWQGGDRSICRASANFLEQRFSEQRQSVTDELSKDCGALRVAVGSARCEVAKRLREELRHCFDGVHWKTLSAIATRGGVFSSSTGSKWSLPQTIAGYAKDVVLFRRAALFTECIPKLLDRISGEANCQLREHWDRVKGEVERAIPGCDGLYEDESRESRAACHDWTPQTKMALTELELVNETLDGLLLHATTEELDKVFGEMACQTGRGTKSRMVDRWSHWCDQYAGLMGEKVATCINDTIADLEKLVAGYLGIIQRYVGDVAKDEAKRVEDDLMQVTTDDELSGQIDALERARRLLDRIRD